MKRNHKIFYVQLYQELLGILQIPSKKYIKLYNIKKQKGKLTYKTNSWQK